MLRGRVKLQELQLEQERLRAFKICITAARAAAAAIGAAGSASDATARAIAVLSPRNTNETLERGSRYTEDKGNGRGNRGKIGFGAAASSGCG